MGDMMRKLLGLVALIAVACAPPFTAIYDANSTIVSGGTGAQSTNSAWTIGSTQHTTRNYSTATWSVNCGTKDNYGLRLTGGTITGPDIGAYGGLIRASQAPNFWPWEAAANPTYGYHYCPGLKSETDGVVLDRWHISGMGDGFVDRANGTIGSDTRFSRSWVYASGDDCVQSDSGAANVAIEDNLCQASWVGISARQTSGDFSGVTMFLDNNIVQVSDHGPAPACYPGSDPFNPDKPCPGHGGWLKWWKSGSCDHRCSGATKAVIRNNVFIADTYPRNSGDLFENAPINTAFDDTGTSGTNEACDGNTLILLTNVSADVTDFNAAVADWATAGCTHTSVYTTTTNPTGIAVTLNALSNWHTAHDMLIQQPGTP